MGSCDDVVTLSLKISYFVKLLTFPMHIRMDLNAVRMFVKLADLKSYTHAAHALRMTQSGLSRAIARLEEALGTKLVQRSTRSVSLTPAGDAFYADCAGIVAECEAIEQRLRNRKLDESETLRVAVPPAFGKVMLVPLMERLRAVKPRLRLDLSVTDRFIDLGEEDFDAAIRIGAVEDEGLMTRQIGLLGVVTVAAPAYLAAHGEVQTPAQLATHNCLPLRDPHSGRIRDWEFRVGGALQVLTPQGDFIGDCAETVLGAAIHGQGICQLQRFLCKPALQTGALRAVLTPFRGDDSPVIVACRRTRRMPPKIAVLLEAMVELPF